jgi:hypothetical protein
LTIESSGHRQELTLRRSEAGEAPLRLVKAPNGANCRVVLSLGSESPSGLRIYCPPKDPVNFSIPAIPTPVIPNRSQGGPNGQGAPVFDFVDPVEEERKRLEAIRLKKINRIKVAAASVVVILVLSFGGNFTYHRYFVKPSQSAFWESIVEAQVPKLSMNIDDSWLVNAVVEGTIHEGDQLAIFSSLDGSQWRQVGRIDLNAADSLAISLGAPTDRYMRIRYVREGRITTSKALYGAFDVGFASRPVVVIESGKVFAQWTSSVDGNRGPIDKFNYRVSVVSGGIQSWYEYFTVNERTHDFYLPENQATREFEVQAVFSNGGVGPWITAVPQS